jgi:hypothetical protein
MSQPSRPVITTGFLQGLIQGGELTLDQLRPGALIGFRPALEVWRELSEEEPHAIYPLWKPGQPLVENLGYTADFGILGAGVVGVTRAALRKAAPGNREFIAAFRILHRWSQDPSEVWALKARTALKDLAVDGSAGSNPGRRVLISALGLPGLVDEFNRARDGVWSEYVKDNPEAGGGIKRTWLQHLEKQAAQEGLAATCNEAAKILGRGRVDLALRNAIVAWALPQPKPKR